HIRLSLLTRTESTEIYTLSLHDALPIFPKAAWGDPMQNSRFSDRWIEDGSYLRLRTISLNYNVPIKNSIIRNASVYAIANNLFRSEEHTSELQSRENLV